MTSSAPSVITLKRATLKYGSRTLWQDLNLDVRPGEFLAVLGANGSGKTSFLKILLGLAPLSSGQIMLDGVPAKRGSRAIGYVPQQKHFAPDTALRARDLVGLGVDGDKWGFRLRGRAYRQRVDELLEMVGAASYGKIPVGMLSGGEQQRLRIAQALASNPKVLLCDEPLLSLDMHHQKAVSALVAEQAKANGTAVVFVTHEINPILEHVDRVLYLAGGRFTLGTPEQVMRTEVLSKLYGTNVQVLNVEGRLVVVGRPDSVIDGHVDPELQVTDAPATDAARGRGIA
ncbi:zinc/manganese transport system ATP-binding protein [Arthrobacter alpinus]|uniref:Zinc/manganese transport system ATP-binding protein n=1 Tax=Arthrobacter alpinus TaxID=656366 RepID=A0A1H5EKU1_9MICC|nr:ABC transporter ATP-binding protein [Arthrobacter alpinus]SED91574.1 zinc/manganese transport system ATP-binding protein [Arthrobacter alpinus]